MAEITESKNFIHAFIEEDIAPGGQFAGKTVHTRFPPEPNGYLHIGHCKALIIDFGTAEKFAGLCNLRMDDTNPTKEDVEFVEAIQEDIHLYDLVIAQGACTDSNWASQYHLPGTFAPIGSWELITEAVKAAENNGARYHVGNVNSSDTFYGDHEGVPEGLDSVYGLKKMGVDFECNMVIGKVLTIDELMGEYGYEAVFVGSGAGLPRFMNIPGESLKGVYSANEFLTRSNLMKAYLPTSKTPIRTGKKVAVVGGGNVAMDAARSALRLGAETVYIVYRRGMAELPARKEEVEHAEEEGIIFKTLCNPVAIHPDEDGFVHSMTCIEMELGEPDASGRRRPIEKQGSEFELEVDTVIMSLGTSPNPLIRSTTPGLETNKHGCIVTEGDEGKTSRDGVYAGGDAVTGAATVIKAMGAGKAAAKAMDEYIRNK